MMWGSFCNRGKPKLVVIEQNINAVRYCEMLRDVFLPFAKQTYNGAWRFQQDNACRARPHTAVHADQFFLEEDVSFLPWPARSPDFNPIENLWIIVMRDMCAGFREFEHQDDLCEAIEAA